MKANQIRVFEQPGVAACVLLTGGTNYLEIDEHGLLVMPSGAIPTGFHLVVAVKETGRTFVVQKDVGTTGGAYDSEALSQLRDFVSGFRATIMRDPIDVITAGKNTWTGWHRNQASNRVDCWTLEKDGKLSLFQVGIVTHDNGKTFRLHGEYRWRGQLYDDTVGSLNLVGKPEHPKWGSLDGGTSNRTQIFNHPEFKNLLDGMDLPDWTGIDEELDPTLPKVTEQGFAVIQWFIFFAGQTGQGIAINREGKPAWVHGIDVAGFDPNSTEPPLWRGDIVSFEEAVDNWGGKRNGPPKLTGVKLVKREWDKEHK